MVKSSRFVCLIVASGTVFAHAMPSNAQPATSSPQTRCGWFENPTPGNAWLTDKDAEWAIGIQGGYQAEGDWPDFPENRWIKTNGNYGYGCACLRVTVDLSTHQVTRIFSAKSKPIRACRKDRLLKTRPD